MSRAVEKFRKDCMVNDVKRDEGLTTPKGVERFDDIRYGSDEKWNVLDVYRPKAEEKRLPVIVSVHGGGWVYGDKELYQFYCMSLAERGFAVVNFTYRLAPEHKYPAPLEDINRVMEWIFQNEAQYGFDLKSVFLVGDSAGAHLAGIYSCICTNRTYASAYSFQVPEGFVPKALALNCGVYERAAAFFQEYYSRYPRRGNKPFANLGMAYIAFAREERHLFELLFVKEGPGSRGMYELLNGTAGNVVCEINLAKAAGCAAPGDLFMKMWIFIHGAACMTLTGDYEIGRAHV